MAYWEWMVILSRPHSISDQILLTVILTSVEKTTK